MSVFQYFYEHSEIAKIVRKRPSDAGPFEQIYRKRRPSCASDEFAVRSKGAITIYLRMISLKDNLPHIIRHGIENVDLSTREKFAVLNLGSGPSHDMIEILYDNQDLAELVKVYAVDYDKPSLNIGKKSRCFGSGWFIYIHL